MSQHTEARSGGWVGGDGGGLDRHIRETRTEKWKKEEALLQQVETLTDAVIENQLWPVLCWHRLVLHPYRAAKWAVRLANTLDRMPLSTWRHHFFLPIWSAVSFNKAELHMFCTEARLLFTPTFKKKKSVFPRNELMEGWRCLWTRPLYASGGDFQPL